MKPSVMVTGGLGFVGVAIVAALEEQHPEWTLSVLDLYMPVNLQSRNTYYICDITDRARVEEAMSQIKPTAVIHTAAVVPTLEERYSRDTREKFFRISVEGTRIILAAAKSNNVRAFVWTGSCTAVTDDFSKQYPNIDETWPTSDHSWKKRCDARACQA